MVLDDTPFFKIHQLVWETYKKFIPSKGRDYYLVPFSIKYEASIYGLIFGSGSLRGVQKFLDICWKKDPLRGYANFDIDNDQITEGQGNLFTGTVSKSKKMQYFEESLKLQILSEKIRTDEELVHYCLENGFLGKHAKPLVKELENNKITCKGVGFSLSSVSKKGRKPVPITLL